MNNNQKRYFTISRWMVSELNLASNDLLVYAIIYGFSQDGESRFYGSIKYICENTGLSRRAVINILNRLVEGKLIDKESEVLNGVKRCYYKACINCMGSAENAPPSAENAPNIKEYNNSKECIYTRFLEKWNTLGLVKHTEQVVKSKWKKKHTDQVNLYGEEKVCKAMENYATIIHSPSYFFDYKWPLWDFIARGLDKFVDDVSPLTNFKAKKIESKKIDPYSELDL